MVTDSALRVGDVVTLSVTGIAHGGVSIARHEGRVVFVHDTMPGEIVQARLIEVKKSFARATTVRVAESAAERVQHIWHEARVERDPQERAGGAEFGHIALSHQRTLKGRVLAEALLRQGGMTAEQLPKIEVAALNGDDQEGGLGWRTRVRLNVDPETGRVGPYAARSRRVIPVKSLPLAADELSLLAPLAETMPDVRSVDLVAPSGADPRMLLTYQGEKSAAGAADVVLEYVYDSEFRVRAGGFWQVHRGAAERLFGEVSAAISSLGDRLDASAGNLDLYGGVGLLAAAFLDAAGDNARVTSVEAVESATDLAAENLAAFNGASALNMSTADYLGNLLSGSAVTRDRARRATVIADPPRSGLGAATVAQLAQLKPANIVYVACDPVAFARDAGLLAAAGWHLEQLRGLDMFPHTHHFETIGLFLRD